MIHLMREIKTMTGVVFRVAVPDDAAQIHALNHRIFAEEIGQHHTEESGLLVDRFHAGNRYFVAVRNARVIGMISAHAGPAFSVTRRLPDRAILERFERPLEVRLLAIEPEERDRTVLAGLLWQVHDYAVSQGFSDLLISGIEARERMYRKLGFRALGPAVVEGAARFIPMAMSLSEQMRANRARVKLFERRWKRHNERPAMVSLMPGPVQIHPRVERAYAEPPVSHRSEAFTRRFEEVRKRLCGLTDGLHVAVFPGGGTLANDVVAANLKAAFAGQMGLVLVNGEFGERVAEQAAAAGLRFDVRRWVWGEAWSIDGLREAMERRPPWVWGVHVETSTGVLNDVQALLYFAHGAGAAVALDCVSSPGAVRMPEAGTAPMMLSGVSGKAIGSYAGLGFCFRSADWPVGMRLCPSFDVGRMIAARGPASTVPSPVLEALAAALEQYYPDAGATARRFEEYARLGMRVRRELRAAGIAPIAPEPSAAPHVTSFRLPAGMTERCREAGFQIACESGYLRAKGWGQIATMGDFGGQSLDRLFDALEAVGHSAREFDVGEKIAVEMAFTATTAKTFDIDTRMFDRSGSGISLGPRRRWRRS